MQAAYPDQFRVDYALSREQQNTKGGKMYIQDKMEEYADEIFGLLDTVGARACALGAPACRQQGDGCQGVASSLDWPVHRVIMVYAFTGGLWVELSGIQQPFPTDRP